MEGGDFTRRAMYFPKEMYLFGVFFGTYGASKHIEFKWVYEFHFSEGDHKTIANVISGDYNFGDYFLESKTILNLSETILNLQIVISRLQNQQCRKSIVAGRSGKSIVILISKSNLASENTLSASID